MTGSPFAETSLWIKRSVTWEGNRTLYEPLLFFASIGQLCPSLEAIDVNLANISATASSNCATRLPLKFILTSSDSVSSNGTWIKTIDYATTGNVEFFKVDGCDPCRALETSLEVFIEPSNRSNK